MSGFAIGPLLVSTERLAAVLALAVILFAGTWLSRRLSPRFETWSWSVLAGGLFTARLGFVVQNWDAFSAHPLRSLAIWEGGFASLWAVPVAALITLLVLRRGAWIAAGMSVGVVAGAILVLGDQLARPEPKAPPTTAFASLDGSLVRLSDFVGKPTVVNLWATWCPPCRREMPALAAAARSRPDVIFIFANQGEDRLTVQTFLARERLNLDHVLLDQGQALPAHYVTRGVPVTLFLGGNGRVAALHMGAISPQQINSQLAKLAP